MDELLVLVPLSSFHCIMGVTNYCERRVRTKTGLPTESDFIFYQKICNQELRDLREDTGTDIAWQARATFPEIGHHG